MRRRRTTTSTTKKKKWGRRSASPSGDATGADAAVAPSIRRRREHDARVTRLFKTLDADGRVSEAELKRGLKNAAAKSLVEEEPALRPLLDPEHWADTFLAIDGVDADADGRVTYHEFRTYCMHIVSEVSGRFGASQHEVPTNEQAIELLKLEPEDRGEEHIDALMLWSSRKHEEQAFQLVYRSLGKSCAKCNT